MVCLFLVKVGVYVVVKFELCGIGGKRLSDCVRDMVEWGVDISWGV